jgi:hypothetical protein
MTLSRPVYASDSKDIKHLLKLNLIKQFPQQQLII